MYHLSPFNKQWLIDVSFIVPGVVHSYEDVELGSLIADEPETWSETVDKKTLKKMNPKDIKRQDTIWGNTPFFITWKPLIYIRH